MRASAVIALCLLALVCVSEAAPSGGKRNSKKVPDPPTHRPTKKHHGRCRGRDCKDEKVFRTDTETSVRAGGYDAYVSADADADAKEDKTDASSSAGGYSDKGHTAGDARARAYAPNDYAASDAHVRTKGPGYADAYAEGEGHTKGRSASSSSGAAASVYNANAKASSSGTAVTAHDKKPRGKKHH